MEKILVSACLIGDKTRYDGKSCFNQDVMELSSFYEIVPFCPEVEGGLSVPRLPSEILHDEVINVEGDMVTRQFKLGAEKAINICRYLGIKIAIMKENSPSCGVHQIYSGHFDGRKIEGKGITSLALSKLGIRILSEDEVPALLEELKAPKTNKD